MHETFRNMAGFVAATLLCVGCQLFPDKETEIRKLLDTDRAFSDSSVNRGMAEAFYHFMDTKGFQLPAGGTPVVGPDAIRSRLAQSSDFLLRWTPQEGGISNAADMGWTWGRYELVAKSDSSVRSVGTYLNVWRKQEDGSWKVLVDIGNEDP